MGESSVPVPEARPPENIPSHLAWAGGDKNVPLGREDFEAMDIALSVVPELRVAALAVQRARQTGTAFPIRDPSGIVQLLQGQGGSMGGHQVDPKSVRRYLVATDFPIENEGDLAATVYVALSRGVRRAQLRSQLDGFDAGLQMDFVEETD